MYLFTFIQCCALLFIICFETCTWVPKIVFCAYSRAFRNLNDKYIFLLSSLVYSNTKLLPNWLSWRKNLPVREEIFIDKNSLLYSTCFSLISHEKAHHTSDWNRFSCNGLIIDFAKETAYPHFLRSSVGEKEEILTFIKIHVLSWPDHDQIKDGAYIFCIYELTFTLTIINCYGLRFVLR